MSLPPINPSSKISLPIKLRELNSSKFKTSLNIKILNSLIPTKSNTKKQIISSTVTKAHKIISEIPSESLKNSKIILSKPKQKPPIIKQTQKKSSSYLKKKYTNFLKEGRNSDFSMDFTKPIRDYFKETTDQHKNVVNKTYEVVKSDIRDAKKNIKIVPSQVYTEKNTTNIIRYANLVMPFPRGAEKRMISKDFKRFSESEKDKNEWISTRYVSQSLQTDANTFEFDDWEFDYDA
ncbi:hypothetical protein SteCoe_21028 [Stentor coeruleus]|uniref:Uncharacterized protein n=1 Tax=Stentor coeruleus TaxID=5963 RepID=A0A1R2BQM9_9CILI|nr:hypothetical protein SteCoe_21028 [Stentor coeruleus]